MTREVACLIAKHQNFINLTCSFHSQHSLMTVFYKMSAGVFERVQVYLTKTHLQLFDNNILSLQTLRDLFSERAIDSVEVLRAQSGFLQ